MEHKTPDNINTLKKQAADKSSYKQRLQAADQLGQYKCQQSKDILWRLMINDKVYEVQESAFRKLQAFGENVKLPKKPKGQLIKDINKKVAKVHEAIPEGYSQSEFNQEFMQRYPEEFDVYSYKKGTEFNNWVQNIISSLPKKKS